MAKINKLLVGEALFGDGNEIAHIDLILGPRGSAAETAFANCLTNNKDGFTSLLAVVAPNLLCKPATVMFNKVTIKNGHMTIDLSGSSGERKAAINSRTFAGARVAYKALTGPLDPVNEGSFRALKVVIPEGNIMMARFPAPMSGWSYVIPTVVDMIVAALAKAMPDRVPGGHHGLLGGAVVFFGVHPKTKRRFIVQSIEGGGWGGRPMEDGVSGTVSVCQGDVRNGSIEGIELKCPVVVERRALRTDSAAACCQQPPTGPARSRHL